MVLHSGQMYPILGKCLKFFPHFGHFPLQRIVPGIDFLSFEKVGKYPIFGITHTSHVSNGFSFLRRKSFIPVLIEDGPDPAFRRQQQLAVSRPVVMRFSFQVLPDGYSSFIAISMAFIILSNLCASRMVFLIMPWAR